MKDSNKRIYGLDLMRCIAILTVIIGHLYWVVGIPVSLDKFLKFEFDGVDIFFTLSGFLIGTILFKRLSSDQLTIKSLFSFWRARWWRTLPAYFFILFLLFPVYLVRHGTTFSHVIPYFFFLQNFHSGQLLVFGESWSLAVEEWFYLTAPVCFFICARYFSLKKAAPLVIIMYFVLGNLIRVYKLSHLEPELMQYAYYIRMALPTRVDAVMFGVLGAYLSFYQFSAWIKYRLPLIIVGVSGFVIQQELIYWHMPTVSIYLLYFHQSVQLLFCLCMLPYLSTLKTGSGAIAKVVTFISMISYSIYLVHGSVYAIYFGTWLPQNLYIRITVYLLVAFAGGYLNYITIEKWGLRQRKNRAV